MAQDCPSTYLGSELNMSKSSQSGFTLIELVVVIVILGILAAFAVPRFARLDGQARIASLRAMEGSLRSGSALARSMWLAIGTNPPTVPMEGQNVAILGGYPAPTATGIVNTLASGTVVALTPGRYTAVVAAVPNAIDFRLNGATNPATCFVRYTWNGVLATGPAFAVTVTGC
jgi:MSHA pilin protein MshA